MTYTSRKGVWPSNVIAGVGLTPALAILFSAVLALSLVLSSSLSPSVAKMQNDTLTVKTASGEQVFKIEVARDDADKSRGLMFRRDVPAHTGMLFPYDVPEELTMWMKNTYVSLDMVFIRADGVVHRIEKRTEPFSERIIASQGAVTAVLEIAAGESDRLGIKPGDRVIHGHFKGKK